MLLAADAPEIRRGQPSCGRRKHPRFARRRMAFEEELMHDAAAIRGVRDAKGGAGRVVDELFQQPYLPVREAAPRAVVVLIFPSA
jgi:hypothetical protein